MTHGTEPHEAAVHVDDDGQDAHDGDADSHAAEELGPVDLRIWGAFVLGVLLGLIPAFGISLAIAG